MHFTITSRACKPIWLIYLADFRLTANSFKQERITEIVRTWKLETWKVQLIFLGKKVTWRWGQLTTETNISVWRFITTTSDLKHPHKLATMKPVPQASNLLYNMYEKQNGLLPLGWSVINYWNRWPGKWAGKETFSYRLPFLRCLWWITSDCCFQRQKKYFFWQPWSKLLICIFLK